MCKDKIKKYESKTKNSSKTSFSGSHTVMPYGDLNKFLFEEAKKEPIVLDEDCEELSPAMMKAFKSSVVQRNRRKKA